MKVSLGFTLIELLISITIISILATLVTASVHVAKYRSKDIHCKNNLRQIGMYMHNISTDSGKFPIYEDNELGKYIGGNILNRDMLLCKLDKEYIFEVDVNKLPYSSYSLNVRLSGKLIDNISSRETPIAFDTKPRHKGARNAVFADLRVLSTKNQGLEY